MSTNHLPNVQDVCMETDGHTVGTRYCQLAKGHEGEHDFGKPDDPRRPDSTITQEQYLQALGLLTLAKMQKQRVEQTTQALAEILNEPDYDVGHVGDAVWNGDRDTREALDEALRKLRITTDRAPKLL